MSYDEYHKWALSDAAEERARLDKFLNDPERYEKALVELERRKAANTEILRSYGFDL
jgi:hypothetical protein